MLLSEYICRTGPFDYQRLKFNSDEEAYQAAIEEYNAFKSGEPERMVSGTVVMISLYFFGIQKKESIQSKGLQVIDRLRITLHSHRVDDILQVPHGMARVETLFQP